MASAMRRAPDRRFVRIHASPASGPITMTASTKASPAGPRFTPADVCAEPCTTVTAAWSRTTMTSPMSVLFPFISLIDGCARPTFCHDRGLSGGSKSGDMRGAMLEWVPCCATEPRKADAILFYRSDLAGDCSYWYVPFHFAFTAAPVVLLDPGFYLRPDH